MDKRAKYNLMKDRLNRLENSPKNMKAGGVVRRLRRQIRNMEKTLD